MQRRPAPDPRRPAVDGDADLAQRRGERHRPRPAILVGFDERVCFVRKIPARRRLPDADERLGAVARLMTTESLARNDAGASRAIERKAATDGRRRLSLAVIVDTGVRAPAATLEAIAPGQMNSVHVGVAGDVHSGVGGGRQQEPIELRTQHLVAGARRLQSVASNRRESLDVPFPLPPPYGVSRRPVEVGAIDRVEDADLREQLARARRQRLRSAARRVGGPGQQAHRVAPLREQARDGRSRRTSADHDDVDASAHRFRRLLGIPCGLSRDIFGLCPSTACRQIVGRSARCNPTPGPLLASSIVATWIATVSSTRRA